MNIGMVTGSRSEYGLLAPLALAIENHPDCELMLAVVGSHFAKEHGNTVEQIKVKKATFFSLTWSSGNDNSPCDVTARVVGDLGWSMAEDYRPDCLIVLGDRYESFAAAVAAHINRIPIVHIHGGEVTEGAYDDALRHGITKMSSLHLVATELYGRRVVQLGENPDSVFNCGALGVEALDDYRTAAKKDGRSVVVCWHPVTLMPDGGIGQLKQMLDVLFEVRDKFSFTVIGPNADSGGVSAFQELVVFSKEVNGDYFDSLPRNEFLTKLASAKFIIGNSSAGIIEAPALGVPTINVGSRQKGREMASSIWPVDTEREIRYAIERIEKFVLPFEPAYIPYGRGGPVAKTMLDTILANKHILKRRKVFYDWEDERWQ